MNIHRKQWLSCAALFWAILLLGTSAADGEEPVGHKTKLYDAVGTNWIPHPIRKGDGKGGWVYAQAEYKFLHSASYPFVAYGMAQMDNGEVIITGVLTKDRRKEATVITFSPDKGDTWSDFTELPDTFGRPTMTAYLGKGNIAMLALGLFSSDYGRTWPEKVAPQTAGNGGSFLAEGNPLVDFYTRGLAVRVAQTGGSFGPAGTGWVPENPTIPLLRWSTDGGRTWANERSPPEWFWKDTFEGKTYARGISEGSLVRAKNGWLVAALRTDVPAKFIVTHHDNMEGIGVSISKDDGRTWSPVKILFGAGRMHPNVMVLTNGDVVMTFIVRQDIGDDLDYASFRRGCEAIVSHDNGLTWNVDEKYILDEWEFFTGPFVTYPGVGSGLMGTFCGHTCSTVLNDGSILTAYGDYTAGGAVLIRWTPK